MLTEEKKAYIKDLLSLPSVLVAREDYYDIREDNPYHYYFDKDLKLDRGSYSVMCRLEEDLDCVHKDSYCSTVFDDPERSLELYVRIDRLKSHGLLLNYRPVWDYQGLDSIDIFYVDSISDLDTIKTHLDFVEQSVSGISKLVDEVNARFEKEQLQGNAFWLDLDTIMYAKSLLIHKNKVHPNIRHSYEKISAFIRKVYAVLRTDKAHKELYG